MSRLPSGADERRRTFHTLDGLRGIAALVVVFRHIPANDYWRWTASSHNVEMFFILSGFVLSNAYGHRFGPGFGVGRFLVQRLIRLHPLYILGTAVGVALSIERMSDHIPFSRLGGKALTFALLLLPLIDKRPASYIYPLNLPVWSLFFELIANVVFAAIAPWLTTRWLAVLLGFWAVLLVVTASHFGSLGVGFDSGTFWGGFSRSNFAFFAGVAIHRVYSAGRWEWLTLPAWASTGLLIALCFVSPPAGWVAVSDCILVLFVLPALVLAAARAEPSPRLGRVFSTLGLLSFPVFALHMPVSYWMKHIVLHATGRNVTELGMIEALLWLVPIIAAAALANHFYDVPVRAWLTRQWRRRSA